MTHWIRGKAESKNKVDVEINNVVVQKNSIKRWVLASYRNM